LESQLPKVCSACERPFNTFRDFLLNTAPVGLSKSAVLKADFQRMLDEGPDLILSDFTLPAYDRMAGLSYARQNQPKMPFCLRFANYRRVKGRREPVHGELIVCVPEEAFGG
jgi:hypothetical protein